MKKICLPALLLLTSTAIAQEIPSSLPVPSVDQFKKVCTAEKIKKLMINEHVQIQEEEALAAQAAISAQVMSSENSAAPEEADADEADVDEQDSGDSSDESENDSGDEAQ